MRHITQEGLDFIKKYEGFSSKPYLCPAGYWTVGYGHLVKNVDNFKNGISEEEAEQILSSDVYSAEKSVARLIKVPLSDNQFNALVSFVFNLGGGALQASTLRRKLNKQEYEGAANEFPKWCHAGGKKLRGLVIRRLSEKNLFLSDVNLSDL